MMLKSSETQKMILSHSCVCHEIQKLVSELKGRELILLPVPGFCCDLPSQKQGTQKTLASWAGGRVGRNLGRG